MLAGWFLCWICWHTMLAMLFFYGDSAGWIRMIYILVMLGGYIVYVIECAGYDG
jgi:hypothetical protein